MRTLTKVGCAVVVGIAVLVGSAGSAPVRGPVAAATPVRGAVALLAFDSCAAALRSFQQSAAPFVGAYGLVTAPSVIPAAGTAQRLSPGAAVADAAGAQQPTQGQPQQEQDHSTTNTHEPGVDEPDLVKTDGRRLITVVDGKLRVVDLASQRVTGTLDLPGGRATQLLTHGNRVLVVVPGPGAQSGAMQDPMVYPPANAAGTQLVLVDLADTPRVLGTLTVGAAYLDARQIDGVARIVIRSQPQLGFVHPDQDRSADTALRENRRVVAESSIADWLPHYELEQDGTRRQGQLVDCDHVSHPAHYSGTSTLTVLTVDLSGALGTGTPVSITADGDTVYGTGSRLYIAAAHTTRPIEPGNSGIMPPVLPGRPVQTEQTDVYQLDISGVAPPRYVAAGEVTGRLLNQYAMSEYQGHLRVATTLDPRPTACCVRPLPSTASSQSVVTVLAQQADALVEVGRVEGLGRGERIYAVRFVGPLGYVVTFRQTDPLYTVDLSDPRRPRLAGELAMTGYSAYLHPADNGLLVGVGQEATDQGRRLGTHVSLFDVGDPTRPRRIAQYQVGYGNSQVEFDQHAFLYWPATGLVVIPMTGSLRVGTPNPSSAQDHQQPTNAALVLRVQDHIISKVGMVSHPASQAPSDSTVRRALVVGDTLWTVSSAGVMANDVSGLVQRAWMSFA